MAHSRHRRGRVAPARSLPKVSVNRSRRSAEGSISPHARRRSGDAGRRQGGLAKPGRGCDQRQRAAQPQRDPFLVPRAGDPLRADEGQAQFCADECVGLVHGPDYTTETCK